MRRGAVRTLLLLSPAVFPLAACSLPQVLGMQLPATPPVLHIQLCSFPALGLLPRAALGHLGLSPSHCLQGTVLNRVQCFPAGEGRFAPASASFPCLSPHLSSPLAAAMECPWSSHVRSQIWLLPLACSSAGSPCFPGFPQQFLPWKSQGILTRSLCAGVLLVELLGLIPSPGAGAGRTFLQAGILPGQETSIISPPFPHGPA